MSQPPTPPAEAQPPQVALTWKCGYQPLPGGQVACTVQLQQGAMLLGLQLAPDDLERLGQALVSTAQQARSGLVIASALPAANGHPRPE